MGGRSNVFTEGLGPLPEGVQEQQWRLGAAPAGRQDTRLGV